MLILVGTGCGNPALLIRPVDARDGLREYVVEPGKGMFVRDKIAVIDVDGILMNQQASGLFQNGENPVSLFQEKLDAAQKDSQVKAAVIRLNTPGGTVAASDAMYQSLQKFRKESGKPVVANMLDVAASGGYYLACGCDGIMAQPTTVTGSIGTIMQTVSFKGTMDKLGIEAVAIKSGHFKDIASPLKPLAADEQQILQDIILQFYEKFVTVVLDGRKNLDREKLKTLADGRVFTGQQAMEAGLVDRVGYPSDAVEWAKQAAGIQTAKVVMYDRSYGYRSNLYSTAPAIPAGSSLINVELPHWLKAEGPQFLYLWMPMSE